MLLHGRKIKHRTEGVTLKYTERLAQSGSWEYEIVTVNLSGAKACMNCLSCLAKGNTNQLFYLFKNLISNAIKITAQIVKGEDLNFVGMFEEYIRFR